MTDYTIKIIPDETRRTTNKLAEAELYMHSGILAGLKLIGFAVWASRLKTERRNVTMPARQYTVNGERRSYAVLRPHTDTKASDGIRDAILSAYAHFEATNETEWPPAPAPAEALDQLRAVAAKVAERIATAPARAAERAAQIDTAATPAEPRPVRAYSLQGDRLTPINLAAAVPSLAAYLTQDTPARLTTPAPTFTPCAECGAPVRDDAPSLISSAHLDSCSLHPDNGSDAQARNVTPTPPVIGPELATLPGSDYQPAGRIDTTITITRTTPEQARADVAAGRPILLTSLIPQAAPARTLTPAEYQIAEAAILRLPSPTPAPAPTPAPPAIPRATIDHAAAQATQRRLADLF